MLVFALVVALDKFGFQVAPLVAGIGVAGIGIGIALQGVLGNVVAGLTIILTKPFRVGEHIALLGVYGDVSRIELFSTTLAHPDRSRIVIPNRKIVGEILHNFGTVRQLPLTVHVAYRSDPATVLALAREVLAADPRVLREPEPVVGISALAESGIAVAVKPWVAVADFEAARGEIYQAACSSPASARARWRCRGARCVWTPRPERGGRGPRSLEPGGDAERDRADAEVLVQHHLEGAAPPPPVVGGEPAPRGGVHGGVHPVRGQASPDHLDPPGDRARSRG